MNDIAPANTEYRSPDLASMGYCISSYCCSITKDTDSFYIGRRNISAEYDPAGPYNFSAWQNHFDANIRFIYESLHQALLYTDEKQDFNVALTTFQKISELLSAIDE